MQTRVIRESGFKEALQGLALSYNSFPSKRVADRLAFKGGGHNKFLESMMVWIEVTAPRYFWQQLDTYRVGTTKQSESTMHTILRGSLTQKDFEGGDIYPETLDNLNADILKRNFDKVKKNLPESFLQKRVVCTSYKTLQNMEYQRRSHKLKEWQEFLDDVYNQVQHPEYLVEE